MKTKDKVEVEEAVNKDANIAVIDAVKELTKVVSDLVGQFKALEKQLELNRKSGKF